MFSLPTLPDPEEKLKRKLHMLPEKRKSAFPPIAPAEEKSLLSDVLSSGVSGLQYLGETLDKPGRAVRGLLAGKPKELANLIPFSDTMGLTDPSESVSGRDLLEKAGALDKNTPGLDWGDVAGFGAEVLTDPFAYLSFGGKALTAAGKLAKAGGVSVKGVNRFKTLGQHLKTAAPEVIRQVEEAAVAQGHKLKPIVEAAAEAAPAASKVGSVPMMVTRQMKKQLADLGHSAEAVKNMTPQQAWDVLNAAAPKAAPAAAQVGSRLPEHLLNQKLGGAFGLTTGPLGLFGIHGTHVPAMAQGPTAEAIVGGLGRASKAVGQTKPALYAKGLFSPEAGGQFTKHGQIAANYAYEAKHAATSKAKMAATQAADDLDSLAKDVHETFGAQLGTSPEGTAKLVRTAAQLAGEVRAGGAPAAGHALKQTLGTGNQEIKAKLADVMTGLVGQQDSVANSIKSKGGNIELMFADQGESPIGHFARFLNTEKPGKNVGKFQARQLKTSFEGAIKRSDPIRHVPAPVLNKMLNDPALVALKGDPDAYSKMLTGRYHEEIMRAARAGRQKSIEIADAKTAALTEKAKQKILKTGKPVPPVVPAALEITAPSEVRDALAEWLRQSHGKVDMVEDAVANHARYMRGAHIADANLDAIHSMLKDSIEPAGVPLSSAFKQIGLKPEEALAHFGKTFGVDPLKTAVHPDAVAAAKSFLVKTQKPEWANHVTDIVDKYTKWFKQNVTLPFPSFASRNHLSGQWMNLASNEIPDIAHAGKYGQEYVAALGMLKNPGAHKSLLDELAAHRVFDAKDIQSLGTELHSQNLGWGMKRTPNPVTPGGMLQNWRDARTQAKDIGFGLGPGAFSETRAAQSKPVKAAISAAATPAHLGAEVNKQIEFLNRVPMYTYLRKHLGWGPEQAASKVRQLQVDYEALAPFEKDVMKRLVPFYSWQRRIVPVMFDQLLQRPGGVTAQTIRASNTGRSKDEFVPPYVGEGMSVNLGGDRYLSGLGLPTDQFADLFVKGPTPLGTAKRTGQKMISQMNPLVKGPLETATGVNTFTGRPIEESFPYPTSNTLANQIIHNSPAARLTTTARQIQDMKMFGGRKEPWVTGLNLGTGLRITDTSGGMDKQRSLAESKMLQEILREDPNIASSTDIYVKRDREGKRLPVSQETELRLRALAGIKKRALDEAKRKKRHAGIAPPA